jgi:hypothetical protein
MWAGPGTGSALELARLTGHAESERVFAPFNPDVDRLDNEV